MGYDDPEAGVLVLLGIYSAFVVVSSVATGWWSDRSGRRKVFAILTEVLPNAADRGKDLGVINIANSLPQVLAPAVAGPILVWLGGYRVLYAAAAAVGLTGALLMRRIRGVA